MHEMWPIVGLVIGVLAVTGVSFKLGLPAPIVLLVAGFGVSFIPGVPDYAVSPELVISVLIPPLLHAAAVESGVIAIKRMMRPILQLSFGMVLITAFAVALVLHAVLPEIPFAAALALGAIVAPPDAVAAVAVGRRVGLPRPVMTVLEGESLFNDATSLVTLKVALAALAGGFSWGKAIGDFAWAVVGGILVGLAVGWLLSFVRRRIATPLTVTALSLVTPYLSYLIGEGIHASGVLAVVVAGLLLGYRAPTEVPAKVRLTEDATWSALRFVLEGAVFALIGLQLWAVISNLDTKVSNVLIAIVAVLLTVILIRPVWIFLVGGVQLVARRRDAHPATGKALAAASWAGMRGVISLAAAQTLPEDTPGRGILLTCTVAVIVGTLVLQGLSLPWFIRRLQFTGHPEQEVAAERERARAEASEAIDRRIEEVVAEENIPEHGVEMMHRWAALRDWRTWKDDQEGQTAQRVAVARRWQKEIVRIEREVFVEMRNKGRLSEEVLRELQDDLDLEEALVEGRTGEDDGGHLEDLIGPPGREQSGPPEDARPIGPV